MWWQMNCTNSPLFMLSCNHDFCPAMCSVSYSGYNVLSALYPDSCFGQLLANMPSTEVVKIYQNYRKVLECVFFFILLFYLFHEKMLRLGFENMRNIRQRRIFPVFPLEFLLDKLTINVSQTQERAQIRSEEPPNSTTADCRHRNGPIQENRNLPANL